MQNPLTAQQFKVLLRVLILAVVAFGWIQLAPQELGGRAAYVVTDGISMQPRFHAGDLAIVRRESSYHVGEIVAYRSKLLHTIVLHRIIGRDGSLYVFKGDNNNFVDLEHPARSQLIGKLWIHAPGLGKRFDDLRSPLASGLLVGLAALLFGSSAFRRGRHERRRRKAERDVHVHRPPPIAPIYVAAGALVALTVVAVISFTRPTVGLVPHSASYRQSGAFSYSGHAATGATYANGVVSTGTPVFLNLVGSVGVGFTYRFSSPSVHRITGVGSLSATIVSSAGWQRTIELEPPTHFTADTLALHGRLDLRRLQSLVRQVETTTQVPGTYTLTLTPHIRVLGAAGELPVRAAYAPTLPFAFDTYELRALPITSGGATPDPSQAGVAKAYTHQTFRLFHVPVGTVRLVSAVGLAGALALLLGFALGIGEEHKPEERSPIPARLRRLLVNVDRIEWHEDARLVEVPSLDELGSLATRYDRAILHASSPAEEVFGVAEDGVLYRFRIPLGPRLEIVRPSAKTS